MARDSRSEVVAINADIVGYSRLIADDFDTTTATMSDYRHLVGDAVSEAGGSLPQFVGDNFMALFDNAQDAVRTAIGISKKIEARSSDLKESRRLQFRMGIDMGEVAKIDDRYHGDALNIAARIQSIALPGGLSVSSRVYQALDEPALRFRPIGRQRMKNIPEQVEVYEFVDLPSHGSPVTAGGPLMLEAPTVAVLPIHTEAVDDQVRAGARLIREDLLHALSRVPELKVINSSEDGDGSSPDLVARYMLETGVHQAGNNVRVYATLFDVTTMNIVKSHRWTAGVDDLFGLSDQVGDEVARAVQIDLIVGEPAGLYAELDDPKAIEKVYLGWYHFRTDTPEGLARALELFESVATTHPDQTYGHVLMAYANWAGAMNGWLSDRDATLNLALEQAREGRRIGDLTGMATAVTAAVLMSQGHVQQAIEVLDGLEVVRPTCDVTFALEGSLRRYMGQWQEAIELLDTAMRLTGVDKPWYPTVKACSLFIGKRYEQAVSLAESVLEYQPHNLEALLVLVAGQAELGLDRRAAATAALITERFPSVDVDTWLAANPYQSEELLDHWRQTLVAVGAIDAG